MIASAIHINNKYNSFFELYRHKSLQHFCSLYLKHFESLFPINEQESSTGHIDLKSIEPASGFSFFIYNRWEQPSFWQQSLLNNDFGDNC